MATNSKFFLTLANGQRILATAIGTSAGAGDADKIIHTGADGRIDATFLPNGIALLVRSIEVTETLVAGDFVNIYDSSGPKVRKAVATDPAKFCNGFVLDGASSGSIDVYLSGLNTQLTGLTPGAKYYLDTTAGDAVTPGPTEVDGNISQFLGSAVSATELLFESDDDILIDIA